MQLLAHLVGRERQEVNLDIGRGQPRTGLEERARGAGGDRQRSLAQGGVLNARHYAPDRAVDDIVERALLRAARDQPDLHVVLQIIADAGRVEHDLDAMLLQEIRRSHAGKLQQLRRIICAAGNQDFLARPRRAHAAFLLVFDCFGATPFEQNALRQRRSLDVQIAARFRRTQIGERRAGAAAATCRGLKKSRAFLGRAVEIGIGRNAGFSGGNHKGLRQRIVMPPVRHRQRPARAVVFVGTALLVLGLLEIGQHVVIAPTGIAALAPAIVILMLTAHIEQAVDRARTAEHFSARLEHLPAVQSRFRLGLVHPVDGFFLEQLSVAERHVDPEIGILRSGLQQQHGMFAVGAQAIGEHTSGRAGADDNVVEFGSIIVLVHLFPRTQPETGSEAVTGGQLPPGRGRGEKAVTPAVLRVSRSPAAGARRTRRRPRAPRRFSGAPRTARFPP